MSGAFPSKPTTKTKVVLVGAASAGKTSLVTRLTTNSFTKDSVTVGAAFFAYEAKVHPHFLTRSKLDYFLTRFFHNPDHRNPYIIPPVPNQPQNTRTVQPDVTPPVPFPMAIWDTAGSESYAKLIRMYFRDADCAVICYDITSQDSWDKVEESMQSVLELSPDALIVLVATKKDLILSATSTYSRCIPVNEVREFALQHGLAVFETSAKLDHTSTQVDWAQELFTFIAHELAYRKHTAQQQQQTALTHQQQQQSQAVDINQTDKKDSKCC